MPSPRRGRRRAAAIRRDEPTAAAPRRPTAPTTPPAEAIRQLATRPHADRAWCEEVGVDARSRPAETTATAAEPEQVEQRRLRGRLEEVPERPRRRPRSYKIQEVIKRRQIILVQVVKEERGNKGAALTTYLSLAGRYTVLMPNTARGGGISRKITQPQDRKRLKAIAEELEVPEGMGLIIRTAGAARTKQEIKRDFEYLLRLWESVRELTLGSTAPSLVYEEGNLIKRSIRDLYTKDIDEIVVAGDAAPPRGAGLHAHADAEPRQATCINYERARAAVRPLPDRAPAQRHVQPLRAPALGRLSSSSTRPRRWSPSTSTPASRRASSRSRRRRSTPTSRRPTRSRAS